MLKQKLIHKPICIFKKMFCELCKTDKLSKEFPRKTLSSTCFHASLHCLRCSIQYVHQHTKCSQCSEPVSLDSPRLAEYKETLADLYPECFAGVKGPRAQPAAATQSELTLATFSGTRISVTFDKGTTIYSLKRTVMEKLGVEVEKQRLLLGTEELKDYSGTKQTTVAEYDIKPNDILQVLIILCALSETVTVVFDLSWGYPTDSSGEGPVKPDALDGTAFLYSANNTDPKIVDFRKKRSPCDSVKHSGDDFDDVRRTGHHKITVNLRDLEESVDKVFFTLSAYNAPSISKFGQPTVNVYDIQDPDVKLCSDVAEVLETKPNASRSKAIVMCCLCRMGGLWRVFSVKRLSNGCAADGYKPLIQTMNNILKDSLMSGKP